MVFVDHIPLLSRLSEIAGCLKCKWPVQVQILKSSLRAAILFSHRTVMSDTADLDRVGLVDYLWCQFSALGF